MTRTGRKPAAPGTALRNGTEAGTVTGFPAAWMAAGIAVALVGMAVIALGAPGRRAKKDDGSWEKSKGQARESPRRGKTGKVRVGMERLRRDWTAVALTGAIGAVAALLLAGWAAVLHQAGGGISGIMVASALTCLPGVPAAMALCIMLGGTETEAERRARG